MKIAVSLRNGFWLTLLATGCPAAFAAEHADLTVKGVIRPSACSVDLSGDGMVYFGTISTRALSDTKPTRLPEQEITMTMTCDAATVVGYRLVDNRAGTAAPILRGLDANIGETMAFGMGTVDGKNLGAYAVRALPADAVADGAAVAGGTRSVDGGATWLSATAVFDYVAPMVVSAWAATDGGEPVRYRTVSQVLKLAAAVDSKANLPALTTNLRLEGSATVSVVYL